MTAEWLQDVAGRVNAIKNCIECIKHRRAEGAICIRRREQFQDGAVDREQVMGIGPSFHCLRVTCVNRLRRAGVLREAAMRLVIHSSELMHRIYQRERVDDVAQWCEVVRFPAAGTIS